MSFRPTINIRVNYWISLCLGLPLIVPLLGCAEADGADPYALFKTFEQQDGLYRFRYLSPPWKLLEDDEEADRQRLAIAPEAGDRDDDPDDDSLDARMVMVVERLEVGTVRDAVAADVVEWSGRAEVSPFYTFTSTNGAVGLRIEAVFPDRRSVCIYHRLANGQAAVMRVTARERLDTPDMTRLFRGFEPMGMER